MDYDDVRRHVVAMAHEAAKLTPQDDAETGLLGTFVGVLYALDRAAALNFDGKRLENSAYMREEFLATARHLAGNGAMPLPWHAGFYVTDFVFRLEALATRMGLLRPEQGKGFYKYRHGGTAPLAMQSMSRGASLKKFTPQVQVGADNDRWITIVEDGTRSAEYLCAELASLFAQRRLQRDKAPSP